MLAHRAVTVQVAKLRMQLWASFLNNSSSRWEAIFDNWQFSLAVMDHISPIYRSDFMRCVGRIRISAPCLAPSLLYSATGSAGCHAHLHVLSPRYCNSHWQKAVQYCAATKGRKLALLLSFPLTRPPIQPDPDVPYRQQASCGGMFECAWDVFPSSAGQQLHCQDDVPRLSQDGPAYQPTCSC